MSKNIKIEISGKSVVYILFILAVAALAWQIRAVFFMIFVAFIMNSALRPTVDYLEQKRIPRLLAVTGIYVLMLITILLITSTVVVQTSNQFTDLSESFPTIVANVGGALSDLAENSANAINTVVPGDDVVSPDDVSSQITDYFKSEDFELMAVFDNAVIFINNAIAFLFTALTVIMISIYMLLNKQEIYSGMISMLPTEKQKSYTELIKQIEQNLGYWVRGLVALMLIVGFLTWLGLVIPSFFIDSYQLDNFALPLAFLAGFLEAVPNLGPVITGIIGFILALGANPLNPLAPAIYVLLMFIAIQQLENHLLTPNIMRRALGLDPVVVIVALIAFYILFGFLGAILALPCVAVMQIVIRFNVNNQTVKALA